MTELMLPALEGSNPLGFLAALGVLDTVDRAGYAVTLRWTDDLVPQAVLGGAGDLDEVIDVLDRDRSRWSSSLVLAFPPGKPLSDAKPDAKLLTQWFRAAADARDGSDADMLCAIVAEGAFDRSGKAKPTHLHFTAGQQQFLEMVRTLAAEVDAERLREAICGPWRHDSPMPSLSWDARGERVYAVRATNPSGEKRLGVPGADWLAFRGLICYPVTLDGRSLRTTGCDADWKRSAFRWPLWSVPASSRVIRSLVGDASLVSEEAWGVRRRRTRPSPSDLAARGVISVLECPIRRSDQGGYGSFGGPTTLVESAMPAAGS